MLSPGRSQRSTWIDDCPGWRGPMADSRAARSRIVGDNRLRSVAGVTVLHGSFRSPKALRCSAFQGLFKLVFDKHK